jgi:CDP-6-deoxy-D-xylo-4-hexulose-3-dehydrase
MKYKFPLATSSWDDKEYGSLTRVIESDMFSMGPEVKRFEELFATEFGCKYALMVNSGSSANLLMTAAFFFTQNPKLKLNRGDEIIVPAVSWSTTYFPLGQYGLKLKFVDINLETLNYDISALSNAITDETKAIMVVNLLGNPNDFDAIENLISGRDIIILEDNCEAMGASFGGKKTGSFGVVGSFSTFFSHHISTMEGGIVVTDNEEIYQIMLCLRAHGWTRNLPSTNSICGKKNVDPFIESFRFVLPGYNLRPIEMSGALGTEQLKKLPVLIAGRRANAKIFQNKLAGHSKFMIQREIGNSSWFGFSLVLRSEIETDRTTIVRQLDELGFECRPIVAGNFVKHDVMEYFDFEISGELKNAEYIDKRGLFVGNHHYPIVDAIEILEKF